MYGNSLYQKTILIAIIIIFFVLIPKNQSMGQESVKKKVLILNSYHKGYKWTDDIVKGIEKVLNHQSHTYIIKKEYMDTKTINDETYFDILYKMYRSKYRNYNFDVIIATDDDAYRFLKKYHDDLFGDTPVVLCGLNEIDRFIYSNRDIYTGIKEDVQIRGTLDLALQLHKDTESIVVTFDNSLFGKYMKERITDIIPDYENRVSFILLQENKLSDIMEKINSVSDKSIILQSGIFEGESKELIPMSEINKTIFDKLNRPIYVLWDSLIGEGVMGGKTISSVYTGEYAAEKVLKLFRGEDVENIEFEPSSPASHVINYETMKNFNIKREMVSPFVKIINKPNTSINIQKKFLYYFVGFLVVISAVINFILASNIRTRKKSEKDLIKEKNILFGILEATADGIMVVDEETKKILHYNNKFIDMWKIPKEMIVTEDDTELISYVKDQLIESDDFPSKIDRIVREKRQCSDVIEFLDGRVFERSYRPLVIKDKFTGSVWSFKDITQRMNFEKELRKSEALYKKLIKLLPDAVFVRKDNELLIANESAFRLFGIQSLDEIERNKLDDVISCHPDYRGITSERVKKLIGQEGTVDFIEQKVVLKNKEVAWVEIGSSSFEFEDNMYILSVIRDIRERKKAEELQKKIIEKNTLLREAKEYDRLKTEFFSTISHELKTPLNIILSGIQLIERNHMSVEDCDKYDTTKKYMKMMKQNCYRLLRLINNLIDITRIDSGFMKLDLKNHNIVNVIENITLSVADYIESKNLTLIFDTEVEEKIMACDVEKLERVMLNLLSNAVKFSDFENEILVNIYDKGDEIQITVKDNGIGIPKDMQEKIFHRFRQVDSSLRRKAEGSGIGLSLVKSIIHLHGGNISVNSEFGRGSEFIITLPVTILSESNTINEEIAATSNTNVERISIEFSDIYS
ncbi:MAG: PAS domain-containing sensor histidine kinase [Firmicutes bacterium]|nr:PAS domain-containing sensor histidine kinase [Bacillota bacterium]